MSGSAWEIVQSIFLIAGGLGLFLFGMKIMSDGLAMIAGDRMRSILERSTSNRFLGILVGILVTIVVNSSSATTIMIVGFVNSGLMNLLQAFGVILGANIGTTISSQIIAFKIDAVAPLFIFIGVVMYMFFKNRNVKNIGFILLGFGVLFFGITVMGMPMDEFAANPSFKAMLTAFENPFLALLAGLIFTAIISSSSATMGILITMYLSGVTLPFQTAAFIILGANIGTCADTLLSSIPASRESKRAAVSHALYNVIGCTIFGSLILIFPGILSWIENTWSEGARQVAMFHTLFNIALVLVFIPFVKPYVKLIQKIIPIKPSEIKNNYEKKLIYINPKITQTAAVAVDNAHREFCRMGHIACHNLELTFEAFHTRNIDKAKEVSENEKVIDYLNHSITSYLVHLHALEVSDNDLEKIGMMLRTVGDIERIGDHAENIAEYVLYEDGKGLKFSKEAMKEMEVLTDVTLKIVKLAIEIYEKRDASKLPEAELLEEEVDRLSAEGLENHIERLRTEECEPRGGVIFTDMILNLERCADHAINIAYAIMGKRILDEKQKESASKSKIRKKTK